MKIKNDITVAKIDGLNYSGQLVVKILSGNKVISTQTYHNNGRETLFKFLCNALAGNYIERQRPCQIKLFSYSSALKTNSTPSDFNWETAFEDESAPTGITPFRDYDIVPVISKTQLDNYATYKTTYHFRIPFTLISGTTIHMAGLYPKNTIYDKNASAYYLFTNDDGTEWQPIEITDNAGNFSLVIDWILTFHNFDISKEDAQKIEED